MIQIKSKSDEELAGRSLHLSKLLLFFIEIAESYSSGLLHENYHLLSRNTNGTEVHVVPI